MSFLIDLKRKALIKKFPALGAFYNLGNVSRAAFSSCGKWLAICRNRDGKSTILVLDAKAGKVVREFPPNNAEFLCLVFHPREAMFVAGDVDGRIHAHWVDDSHPSSSFSGHAKGVNDIAFVPGSAQFASAGRDRIDHLWDTGDFHKVRSFTGHDSMIYGVAVSADGAYLATNSWDKTAVLYDLRTGRRLLTQDLHDAPVTELHFIPNSESIATFSALNAVLRVWPRSPLRFAKRALTRDTESLPSVLPLPLSR